MNMNTLLPMPNETADVRSQIRKCLNNAISLAENPATVFCIEPFNSVDEDGGGRLGRLLARAMRKPDRTALVVAERAFVFVFAEQLGQTNADQRQRCESMAAAAPGEEPPLSREGMK